MVSIVKCPICSSESLRHLKEDIQICNNPKCNRAFCTDNSNEYNNRCWFCKNTISSLYDIRCGKCKWYICPHCGAHKKNCNGIIEIKTEIIEPVKINFFDPAPDYIGDYDDLYNTF